MEAKTPPEGKAYDSWIWMAGERFYAAGELEEEEAAAQAAADEAAAEAAAEQAAADEAAAAEEAANQESEEEDEEDLSVASISAFALLPAILAGMTV